MYVNVDDRSIEKTYVHSYEAPIAVTTKSKSENNEPCVFCTGGAAPIGGLIQLFSEQGYQDFKTWDASFFDTEQGMNQGLIFGASVVTAIFTGGASLSWQSGFGFIMAMNQVTAGLDGQGPITELVTMCFGSDVAQGVEIVGMFFDISGAADNVISATIAFSNGQTAIGVYNTVEGAWTSYSVVTTATEVTNGDSGNTTGNE